MALSDSIQLVEFPDLVDICGVPFPRGPKFRQYIITGPPGSGKSSLLAKIRGWPNEGYIDLTRPGWWRDPSLTYRPREVHLGLPFKGQTEGLTVFEPQWMGDPEGMVLEPERIVLPKKKRSFFSVDWLHKYTFEFLIPPAEQAIEWRRIRLSTNLVPAEENITVDIIKQQNRIYLEAAVALQRLGLAVYVRPGLYALPHRIEGENAGRCQVGQAEATFSASLVQSIRLLTRKTARIRPGKNFLALSGPVRIEPASGSLRLRIAKKEFHLVPDRALKGGNGDDQPDWLLYDPLSYPEKLGGFCRLKPGGRLAVGNDPWIAAALGQSADFARPGLRIEYRKPGLCFYPHGRESAFQIARLPRAEAEKPAERRRHLLQGFSRACRLLDRREALHLLKETNALLESEAYRPRNHQARPGAILDLPPHLAPVIVGDLHARLDNLLKILTQNGLLQTLGEDKAALLLLGDFVHRDGDHLEEMASSCLMIDFLCRLKLRFPGNVFFLRGNHESFSADVAKGGIAQGQLFEGVLKKHRGDDYADEMSRFFGRLALIARSDDFIACHAGPVCKMVSYETLVNLQDYPALAAEVMNGRALKPGIPFGYTRGDVRRFRRLLKARADTPFFVGHTRITLEDGVWFNTGRIPGNHVLYSSGQTRFGMALRVKDTMVAMELRHEPLINALRGPEPGSG